MGWPDIIILVVIAALMILGFIRGFLFSIYKLLSIGISIFLSMQLWTYPSQVLIKIGIASNIKKIVLEGLKIRLNDADNNIASKMLIDRLKLPSFLADGMKNFNLEITKIVDINSMLDKVSSSITDSIIKVFSIILLFVLIWLLMHFIGIIIRIIVKLPILHQLDKIGGIVLGGVEGIVLNLVIFAGITIYSSIPKYQNIHQSIDASLIAKYFYGTNNFILNLILK